MDLAIETKLTESKMQALKHPKYSYQLAKDAYKLSLQKSLEEEQAYARFHMAYACRVMSEYNEGLTHALASLKMFQGMKNPLGIIKASNIVGIIYFYYGDLTRSLRHFLEAMEGLNQNKNPVLEVSIMNNIGEVYRESDQLNEAITWFLKGKNLASKKGMDNEWATIATNLGEVYYRQGREIDAFNEFEQAYATVMNSDNILLQGELATKLGRSYRIKQNFEQARYYFNEANTCFSQIENKYYYIELLQNKADLEEDTDGDPLVPLQEALSICQRLNLDKKMSALYASFSSYYERIQDYAHALEYHKLFHLKEKEIEASYLSDRMEILMVELENNKEKNELQRLSAISQTLKKDIELARSEVNRLKERNNHLQKENGTDPLTKTYNRRGIQSMYKLLLKNYPGWDIGLLMVDIDYFKQYNDRWGHIKGDVCLNSIARVLNSHKPDNGFVGRFGGEEFIVCFPVGEDEAVQGIAERIRYAIEDLRIVSNDKTGEVVTVSIGGGRVEHTSRDIMNHIERIDRLLYRAKDEGRNRICVEDELRTR